MATIFNGSMVVAELKALMHNDMVKIAEPLVQEALKKYESEFRRKLGEHIIAIIDQNFHAEMCANQLVIRVDYSDGKVPRK